MDAKMRTHPRRCAGRAPRNRRTRRRYHRVKVAMVPHLNVLTAFLAGLVSFVSPCVLPLVPSYLSFLTGTSLEDLKTQDSAAEKARVLAHAVAFVCGFTLIFVLIGLSASAIGSVFANNKDVIARIGGVIIIILGLNMLG